MTVTMNMKKSEIIEKMEAAGMMFSKSFTKEELVKLYNAQLDKNEAAEEETKMKNEVIEMNEVALLNEMNRTLVAEKLNHFEETQEETTATEEDSMTADFATFLYDNQVSDFELIDNTFLISGPKKKICVKIDELTGFANVFTVLNKKEFKKENARNILTLKSLKAVKSYTISNLK